MLRKIVFGIAILGSIAQGSAASEAGEPSGAPAAPQSTRPNIVLILADDLGYSDIGAFGGEIRTPNLDALALRGARLTDFHASPTCSPTRSMLLSGTDNHTAGLGAMAEAPVPHDRWGYEGFLTTRVGTLAERLGAAGYRTIMSGKWHLGLARDQWPDRRGFEHSFALLQGAHNHFGKGGFGPPDVPFAAATYVLDDKEVQIPDDFYSSDYFTSQIIDLIGSGGEDERPFFAYLAFTAPHSPLQAPADVVEHYRGRYDAGWAKLREERIARMREMGLISGDANPAPMIPDADSWSQMSHEERAVEARHMEVYAAMVERLDENVGRLVAYLRKTGQYVNTLFLFSSDNGPAGETARAFSVFPGQLEKVAAADNSLDNIGAADSFVFSNPYWAQAASAPAYLYKGFMAEGGTRVAAFVTYSGFKRQGTIDPVFASVMDVVPTLLEVAGAEVTGTVDGREVAPVRGGSLVPYLERRAETIHPAEEAVAFELHGQRAVRRGSWKLLMMPRPFGAGDWTLHNLDTDPAEQVDLSARYPRIRQELLAAWDCFAGETRLAATP